MKTSYFLCAIAGTACFTHASTVLVNETFDSQSALDSWSVTSLKGETTTAKVTNGKLDSNGWNQTIAYTTLSGDNSIRLGSGAQYTFSFNAGSKFDNSFMFFLAGQNLSYSFGHFYKYQSDIGLSDYDLSTTYQPSSYMEGAHIENGVGIWSSSNRTFTISGTIVTQTDGTNIITLTATGANIGGSGTPQVITFHSFDVLDKIGFGLDGGANVVFADNLNLTRTIDPVSIPEPAVPLLSMAGLAVMILRRRKG